MYVSPDKEGQMGPESNIDVLDQVQDRRTPTRVRHQRLVADAFGASVNFTIYVYLRVVCIKVRGNRRLGCDETRSVPLHNSKSNINTFILQERVSAGSMCLSSAYLRIIWLEKKERIYLQRTPIFIRDYPTRRHWQ